MLCSPIFESKLEGVSKKVYILMINHMGFTSQLKVYLGMYLETKQDQP